jgi:hypothetical protein
VVLLSGGTLVSDQRGVPMTIPMTKFRWLVAGLMVASLVLYVLIVSSPILLVWQVWSLGGGVESESGSPDWIARRIPAGWFLPWDTVVGFELRETTVSIETLQRLIDLPSLEQVWLQGVSIVNEEGRELEWRGRKIRHLGLCDMRLRPPLLARLPGLTGLVYLHLTDSRVSDTAMRQVARCPKLEMLWLTNSSVTDAGLHEIRGLSRLFLLDLEGTAVGSASMASVPRSVRILNVRGTCVDDGCLPALENRLRLGLLDIRDTRITPAGGKRLISRLPDCRVNCDVQRDESRAAGDR